MPISRNGKVYFTDEQKEEAMRNNNAAAYALAHGYRLKRVGNSYQMMEHDSMVFLPQADSHGLTWYWNSQRLSGNAIDFAMKYEGKTYVQAILELAGEGTQSVHHEAPRLVQTPKRPFVLPEAAPHYNRMFAYLCKQRGVDHDLVVQLAHRNQVYQAVTYSAFDIAGYDDQGKPWYMYKDGRMAEFQDLKLTAQKLHDIPPAWAKSEIHERLCVPVEVVQQMVQCGRTKCYQNVCMVGHDPFGRPRYASLRSMGAGKAFKIDVTGSDKSHPFVLPGRQGTDTLCVLESPIEAMSYWSLCNALHSPRLHATMIGTGGAGVIGGLQNYLLSHPEIHRLILGLNNDSPDNGHEIRAGQNGMQAITDRYAGKYDIVAHLPRMNDWNDELVNFRQHVASLMQQVVPQAPQKQAQQRSRQGGEAR